MTQAKIRTRVTCSGCNNTFATRSARRHIRACMAKAPQTQDDQAPMLLVIAKGDYGRTKSVYHMHTLFPPDPTLRDIHVLLRRQWLECCHHLSLFRVGPQYYTSDYYDSSFFEDEETSYEFIGTVTQITKQIGNAVPVNLAAALVKASLQPGQPAPV